MWCSTAFRSMETMVKAVAVHTKKDDKFLVSFASPTEDALKNNLSQRATSIRRCASRFAERRRARLNRRVTPRPSFTSAPSPSPSPPIRMNPYEPV